MRPNRCLVNIQLNFERFAEKVIVINGLGFLQVVGSVSQALDQDGAVRIGKHLIKLIGVRIDRKTVLSIRKLDNIHQVFIVIQQLEFNLLSLSQFIAVSNAVLVLGDLVLIGIDSGLIGNCVR